MTCFFRLLKTPIDAKGDRLAEQVQAVNESALPHDIFAIEVSEFKRILGSPLAYWASESTLHVFRLI